MKLLQFRKMVGKADQALFYGIASVEAILLLGMVIINALQTFSRYNYDIPVWWVQDISILCLMANTVLGAGVCWSRNEHLVLDLTDKLLPAAVKEALWWIMQIVMVAGGVALFNLSLYTMELYKNMVISLVGYPEAVKSLIVGIAGLVLAVAALFQMVMKALDYSLRKQGIVDEVKATGEESDTSL